MGSKLRGRLEGILRETDDLPTLIGGDFNMPIEYARMEKFRSTYKSDPVYGAHYAYDAVYLVADALARNASLDKTALLATPRPPASSSMALI